MTEPVAWMATDRGKTLLTDDTDFILKMWKHNGFKIEPLYLLRELTDEEIMEIYDREELYNIDEGQMYLKPIEFAKELLKKASGE